MTIDTDAIKANTDLRAMVESDLGLYRRQADNEHGIHPVADRTWLRTAKKKPERQDLARFGVAGKC